MIGRERPGQQSEVATLIQQTLEQERRQRELLEQQYAHYDADDDEVMTMAILQHAADATIFIRVTLSHINKAHYICTYFPPMLTLLIHDTISEK